MQSKKKRKKYSVDCVIPSDGSLNLWQKKEEVERAKNDLTIALKDAAVMDAIIFWIRQLLDHRVYNPETTENYRRYLEDLYVRGVLPANNDLGAPFCVGELDVNREVIIDLLVREKTLTDNGKRYRLNALIAFSKFLESETQGQFRKFECPQNLTFSPTNKVWAPKSLTAREYGALSKELWQVSKRDGLIIDLVYYTGRPLSDILSISLDHVNQEEKAIRLKKGLFSTAYVRIQNQIFKEILCYLDDSREVRKDSDKLFVTSRGKPIFRTRFAQLLKQASEKASLGFVATSTMIQRSYIEHCLRLGMTAMQVEKKLKLVSLNMETVRRRRHKK